jgi:hypothetical protein
MGIDESADQPGAGDAVDLWALARDPARGPLTGHTPVGALGKTQCWPGAPLGNGLGVILAILAAFHAAGHGVGLPAGSLQRGCGLLADVVAVDAVNNNLARRMGGGKGRHVFGRTALRTSQQARTLVKAGLTAHVQHQRGVGTAKPGVEIQRGKGKNRRILGVHGLLLLRYQQLDGTPSWGQLGPTPGS